MQKQNVLKYLALGFAAGAGLALLAGLVINASPAQAQAPAPPVPQAGVYQISTWSATDAQGNVYVGMVVLDTRSGRIIDSEYDTVTNMVNKYKK